MAVTVPTTHVRVETGRRMLPGRVVRQDDWRTIADGLNQVYGRHLRCLWSCSYAEGSPPAGGLDENTNAFVTIHELAVPIGTDVLKLELWSDAENLNVRMTAPGVAAVTNAHGARDVLSVQTASGVTTGDQIVTVEHQGVGAGTRRLYHLAVVEVELEAADLP